TGRSESTAGGGAPSAEAGRKAGGDQLSFARRQNRQGCASRGCEAGLLPAADQEAGDGGRRRDRSQSAVAQRQDAGGRKSIAPKGPTHSQSARMSGAPGREGLSWAHFVSPV